MSSKQVRMETKEIQLEVLVPQSALFHANYFQPVTQCIQNGKEFDLFFKGQNQPHPDFKLLQQNLSEKKQWTNTERLLLMLRAFCKQCLLFFCQIHFSQKQFFTDGKVSCLARPTSNDSKYTSPIVQLIALSPRLNGVNPIKVCKLLQESLSEVLTGNVSLQPIQQQLVFQWRVKASGFREVGISKSENPKGGAGLFALKQLRKFQIFYRGQVISQLQCQFRENYYSPLKIFYNFTLSHDAVIDAFRFGNQSRFINHRSARAANIKAEKVGEDIRLRGKETIQAGEQLFFDYRSQFLRRQLLEYQQLEK